MNSSNCTYSCMCLYLKFKTFLSDVYESPVQAVNWHNFVPAFVHTCPFLQQKPSYPTGSVKMGLGNCQNYKKLYSCMLMGSIKSTFNQEEAECSKNCDVCEKLPIKWVDIRIPFHYHFSWFMLTFNLTGREKFIAIIGMLKRVISSSLAKFLSSKDDLWGRREASPLS